MCFGLTPWKDGLASAAALARAMIDPEPTHRARWTKQLFFCKTG